jgi:hypothetical protein
MSIGFEVTDYHTADGHRHEALRVLWDEVTQLLGHQHAGIGSEDDALVAAPLTSGAPASVIDAERWEDEQGWGLVGPETE